MIKYLAYDGYMRPDITPTECDKETEHFVIINGSRRAKRAEREVFFDSFQDAKEWLVLRAEARLESARSAVQRSQDKLSQAKGLNDTQAVPPVAKENA